jgi:transposase
MSYYAGVDVSLESSHVCVIDGNGKIVREAKVASEPEALIAWLGSVALELTRIGLEAGPLSQWLYAAMRDAGLAVELLETRHVRNAFKIMPVKTDRKDAQGIAELMRLGWFRPVHCKSMEAQETRAMLTARKLVQKALHEVEMSLRGVLRGFGLKIGKVAPTQFEARIRKLVEGHPSLEVIATAMLSVRATLRREFNGFEKRLRAMARSDVRAKLLMSVPGVGTIVALTYAAAIDDPARFTSSKTVGAHFGLTPTRYQSGETDRIGRISKIGDASVRAMLYESAHIIITRPVKGCTSRAGRCGLPSGPVRRKPRWRSPASSPSSCIECSSMERRSRPSQRSAVLGTIKDKPSVAKWPSLTVPARDAPQVRGRDEGMAAAVEQRNLT